MSVDTEARTSMPGRAAAEAWNDLLTASRREVPSSMDDNISRMLVLSSSGVGGMCERGLGPEAADVAIG